MLPSAPSFSIYNDGVVDGENGGHHEDLLREVLERSVTIGDSIEAAGSGEFSFGGKSMGLIEEEGEEEEGLNKTQLSDNEGGGVNEPVNPRLHLAPGLGIDGIDLSSVNFNGSGDVEGYFKRLVDEYPCHPLFLRNYAQLLQSKGDLHGAEDYYHRATLADPQDGEILMQYAKLVWELHRDRDRALSYFERATKASPEDSNVLAAYASFLWEIEEDEEDRLQEVHLEVKEESVSLSNNLQDKGENEPAGEDVKTEDYYRRMVKENPSNSLVLRNYAHFLYQSKGDLQGAEKYYLQALLADPKGGETMSEYAKLVWELYHDHDKASCYFEQAVQATPGNSHVLAAYASFLWETEENEEDSASEDQTQVKEESLSNNLQDKRENERAGQDVNTEDYYRRMVKESPGNSLALGNYAHFLYQSKGDLQGAEKYYLQALLADPENGEIMSEYAKLVWELYRDPDKASCYFEQAVRATPGNSYVLAAYASFLWETEEDEADSTSKDQTQVSLLTTEIA